MTTHQKLEIPQAVPVIKPNGDVAIEVTHYGEVVGGINVTKVVAGWFEQLGIFQPPKAIDR